MAFWSVSFWEFCTGEGKEEKMHDVRGIASQLSCHSNLELVHFLWSIRGQKMYLYGSNHIRTHHFVSILGAVTKKSGMSDCSKGGGIFLEFPDSNLRLENNKLLADFL